jgi:hypothetical protein
MGETVRESAVFPDRGALKFDRRLPPNAIEADGQRGRTGRSIAGMFLQL